MARSNFSDSSYSACPHFLNFFVTLCLFLLLLFGRRYALDEVARSNFSDFFYSARICLNLFFVSLLLFSQRDELDEVVLKLFGLFLLLTLRTFFYIIPFLSSFLYTYLLWPVT